MTLRWYFPAFFDEEYGLDQWPTGIGTSGMITPDMVTTTNAPSIYQLLEKDSIRLMLVEDDSGLSCSLQPYKSAETPQYSALSYTRGLASYRRGVTSKRTCRMTINDEEVEVQENLHDALRHLGRVVRNLKEKPLC